MQGLILRISFFHVMKKHTRCVEVGFI